MQLHHYRASGQTIRPRDEVCCFQVNDNSHTNGIREIKKRRKIVEDEGGGEGEETV